MISNKHLFITQNKNTATVNLHDTVNDFYSKKGLPLQLKDGTILYAPVVYETDLNATGMRFQDETGTYRIGISSIGNVQQLDKIMTSIIALSGNKVVTKDVDSMSFIVPYATKIHLKTDADIAHYAHGVSGNSWQYSNFDVVLDGNTVATLQLRKSYGGRAWRTICDKDIEVVAGSHILLFRMTGKCSSKDSHETEFYGWKNTVTLGNPLR